MTASRGRFQAKRGLIAMGPALELTPATDTRPTQDTHDIFPIPCPIKSHEAQIIKREKRIEQTGQLSEFAIMLQIRADDADDWLDVARVDCAHGSVHVDRCSRSGVQTKDEGIVPSRCKTDLDAALKWAVTHIWDTDGRLNEWL